MSEKKGIIKCVKISNTPSLNKAEKNYRKENAYEIIPYANGTSYSEVAEKIIMDKEGPWKNPLLLYVSEHRTNIGAQNLCSLAHKFFMEQNKDNSIDILSISAHINGDILILHMLVRPYNYTPDVRKFFDYVGETDFVKKQIKDSKIQGKLIVPEKYKDFAYTDEEILEHKEKLSIQQEILKNATLEKPFLNSITSYTPVKLYSPLDYQELIYDLRTKDEQASTMSSYEEFINMFEKIMKHINNIEFNQYVEVLKSNDREQENRFLKEIEKYIVKTYVKTDSKEKFPAEDVPVLMKKIHNALFQLYVVQDLVDDPLITDIKITAPDTIRTRIKGRAYLSNITFLDVRDYYRFIVGIAIRNRIDLNIPSQVFTYTYDEDYILRITISAEYTNSVAWPYLHIRKVARKKLMDKELIEAGMMTELLRDYLLDCGRFSKGVVFAGPPGSGKTIILNWFLEAAYEQSAEILVIQESDELFSEKKGIMFKHVVNNPKEGEVKCSLEDLGKIALVEGCNVFVIGETKGAEICSALTLSNSGCRTAMTIHSDSEYEVVDKMADLALRGYAQSIEEAKRMIKSFQTIVYLEDFKIQGITEIIGYDEEKKDMIYRPIYKASVSSVA